MPKGQGPRPKSKRNSEEYEKRLRTVLHLFIYGYSEEEIAQAVSASKSTVSYDLDEIQRRNQSAFDQKLEGWQDPKTIAAQVYQRSQVRRRKFWDVANESQGTAKVVATRETREEDDWEIKTLQRLGLIYEEPTKSENIDNYDEFIARYEKRKKERGDL